MNFDELCHPVYFLLIPVRILKYFLFVLLQDHEYIMEHWYVVSKPSAWPG